MKYRHLITLLASLFVVTACDQVQTALQSKSGNASPASTAHQVIDSPVVATVNGASITQAALDVYKKQRQARQADQQAEDDGAVLNELIALELMRQESVSKGLDTSQSVLATLDQQTRTVLAGAAIQDYMSSNPVTDEETKKFYDAQIGQAGKEYSARHILLESEADAADVIAALEDGADFSALAKEKSTGPSGATGGKLGWFAPGQMVKEFSDAAALLEKGSYTKTPVQTQFGWHVIMLDDTRESTPPGYEEVSDRLKMIVANQKLQQHVQAIKSAAKIEITGK
ncbi:MAG: peptidylprolyl isomerase [Gammaproteobacteria bacterium]